MTDEEFEEQQIEMDFGIWFERNMREELRDKLIIVPAPNEKRSNK